MAAGRLTARSDADLIQASKRGDLSAFEEIYAAHAGRMKSIAFHLLADRADAEDAVQEAFLKIYRAAGAIQFDSGLAPWIYRILLNCCYDTGRKRKRQAESPLPADPPAIPKTCRCRWPSGTRSGVSIRNTGWCSGCSKWRAFAIPKWRPFWKSRKAPPRNGCSKPNGS